MRQLIFICAIVCAVAAAAVPALAADSERGKLLHETHCRMCHDSIAYKRDNKLATDYAQVKAQVIRWQTNTGLHWSQDDIDSVTAYVAETYYELPAPAN